MARWIGGITVLICIALFAWFKLEERQFRLSHVPEGLNVLTIIYSNERSWGFGPGGNETGLIVYELPETTALEIQKSGIAYFATLPEKAREVGDWRGSYQTWQATPTFLEGSDSGANRTSSHEIANYLNKHGFGIQIDTQIELEINNAIAKLGSYFAYGRNGILIVIPGSRRVVYAYN